MPSTFNITILGGGISGLSTAWYLSRSLPKSCKITIIEASNRLGGWIQSRRHGEQGILFEYGPRTLRPGGLGGLAVLELIKSLNLIPSLITIPKTHPAALNRYIYYPDRLNKLPHSLLSLAPSLSRAFIRKAIPGILREPFVKPANTDDESITAFIARRFNSHIADNIMSAVIHGIYAGDANQLSVRSVFPSLYYYEHYYGSVLKGLMRGLKEVEDKKELERELGECVGDLINDMSKISIFSFKDGIQMIVDALERELRKKENVAIKMGEKVVKLEIENEKAKVYTESSVFPSSHIISTLSSHILSRILTPTLPYLSQTPSVTVAVVNLAYSNPSLLPVTGFGYLIPASIPNNIYSALGVVFDSDAVPSQDKVNITKLTVMLGGHYYYGMNSIPNEDELLSHARWVVSNHLGIREEPMLWNVTIQRECISQYQVGHLDRMRELHHSIRNMCGGRLSVAGASYLGVSVNDIVLNSRMLAGRVVEWIERRRKLNVTGLESVEEIPTPII
ncbi:702_t:CDS:2 [Paraglomus brasilianum]|uniref:Protoporphyrinogen oxidase n=1 Tax=Paraglomus brasilianum TaxID=144538 RepID=A0A9N9ACN1_9GLOM|nr:702_t:CDS:2 [Paraglomus brasilianum]